MEVFQHLLYGAGDQQADADEGSGKRGAKGASAGGLLWGEWIAAGGGGIPVLEQGTVLKGASAVIEKDLIAGLLADGVEADMLIILTGEESVYKNYGTDKQESIREMTCAEARRYIAEGEFGEGTMLPKIETAISYIGDYATRSVLITKLGSIEAAMAGQTGTIIKK